MSVLSTVSESFRSSYFFEPLVGVYRKRRLRRLMKKYGFAPWHLSPKELRPYALDLIATINGRISPTDVVVEVGCGLGEIIRSIRSTDAHGIDNCPKVIEGAKVLDRKSKTHFRVGTFSDVRGMKIQYFISVNFIHTMKAETLREIFSKLCAENEIEHLVVDRVPAQALNRHQSKTRNHDFDTILPAKYRLESQSRTYVGGRTILIYKKLT